MFQVSLYIECFTGGKVRFVIVLVAYRHGESRVLALDLLSRRVCFVREAGPIGRDFKDKNNSAANGCGRTKRIRVFVHLIRSMDGHFVLLVIVLRIARCFSRDEL